MMVCDDGHEEIVCNNHRCPLCAARAEIDSWERTDAEQREIIESLKDRIGELEEQLNDARQGGNR